MSGLSDPPRDAAASGRHAWGLCSGYQMMGNVVRNSEGWKETADGGPGLPDVKTPLLEEKQVWSSIPFYKSDHVQIEFFVARVCSPKPENGRVVSVPLWDNRT